MTKANQTRKLSSLAAILGPGMLFAASAVGVSHLVQSTRAGANFGLTLGLLIIAACVLKYPAFRFASDYSAITGETLLQAYRRQGRIVLILFALILPVDMFIATAAVSLVTAGLTLNVLGLNLNIVLMCFILMCVCMMILLAGKYRLFENLIKALVLVFSLITVLATVSVLPRLLNLDVDLTPVLEPNKSTILFMIAVAGWMPTSITASVFQSLWVCARQQSGKQKLDLASAKFDFNIGYLTTIFLALCFMLMGATFFYSSGIALAPDAVGFAGQLLSMFSAATGAWLYPVVSLAALVVMYSTVMTLLDAGPRAASDIINKITDAIPDQSNSKTARDYYPYLIVLQVIVSSLILLVFLTSFKNFIDFATSIAFLTAPALAFLNHRAIFSQQVPSEQQPGLVLKLWSWLGILIMTTIAICYLYYQY